MPTITVSLDDIVALIGKPMEVETLEEHLRLAKAELDAFDPETREARVELNDTNRPDLWCAEGIARQIRSRLEGRGRTYPFFDEAKPPVQRIEVDPSLEKVRPFVAAFTAKGPAVSEAFLVQLIQTQEKLCENYGRKRRNIAIGIYNTSRIRFPVKYRAVKGDEVSYVPLGFEEPMTLDRILEEHPKGKEYKDLVRGFQLYPLLTDTEGAVLSFPPIVNSRETGEVVVGDRHLLVEATGTNMRQLLLCMNIMAANFADRGWEVEPVLTCLPYDSQIGREVRAPASLGTTISLPLDLFDRMLGERFERDEITRQLAAYGVETLLEEGTLKADCPPYRDDYLHAVDVLEDFAISRGYPAFEPVMPSRFTVGKLKPISMLADRVRDHMIGLGFEEVFSNILTNRSTERDRMGMPDEPILTVSNVMSETYSVLRGSVLPSLLRVEAQSSKAMYPHRLFEVGEVCIFNPRDRDGETVTQTRVAALWAAADTGFSEVHSVLDLLLYYLVKDYSLRAASFPFYFEGRSGEVLVKGEPAGHIGEIHPEVLTRFNITMPCAGFEVVLDLL